MKKRILSILMALCLALTLWPAAAFAEEDPVPAVPTVDAPAADPQETPENEPEDIPEENPENAPANDPEGDPQDAPALLAAQPLAVTPTGTPLTQALLGTWLEKEDPYNPNSGKIYKMPSGNYYLAEDIYLVGDDADPNSAWPLIISEGDVTLDLNGHVLDLKKQNICIYSNVSLTDSSPEAEHKFRVEDSGLWVLDETQGKETIAGGIITGGTGVEGGSGTTGILGGGVNVTRGSLTMNGGSIVGCTANNGGGLSVFYGSFTMNSGSIAGCTAVKSGNAYGNGGGVYVGDSATFNMNDGSIVGCTADGGGVFVDDSATFTMNDGSIENCTADIGGGVYVGNLATFNMNDGSIKDCTADIGGGVYMGGLVTFNMTGGNIESCTADSGGGVYVGSGAQFEMNSGGEGKDPTIKNCIAVRAGGGVFVDGSATFTMNDGSITDCTANGTDNAIHADGNFTDNNSTIDKSLVSGINAGHTGSETDPILIGSAAGLKDFRNKVNGGKTDLCATLVCDIVLNDGTFDADGTYMGANGSTSAEQWTPIGDSSNLYAGTFDGGGHTIKGLYVDVTGIAGLFGEIEGATIQDVTVDGYVKGTSVAGGIVGTASNSATSIQNCVNRCYVVAESSSGTSSGYAGGIVGFFSAASISGCANTGAVSGTYCVGGIAGSATGDTGGSSGSISGCYNTGAVSGTTNVGGVAGYASASTVSSCYNTGAVSGTTNVGGVVGYASASTVSSCYNTGTVSGDTSVGGVVGCVLANASVTSCYNTGKVEGTNQVGGVAGTIVADEDANASITSCCYLTDTAEKTIGENAGGTVTNVDARSKADFADGTVLALLKGDRTDSPWTKTGYLTAAGMTLPLLSWQTADAHICTPENPSQWGSDANGHWQVCSCGLIVNKAAHSGGTATSSAKAKCSTCGAEYGELAAQRYYYYTPTTTDTKKPSPKTADESNMTLWCALLLCSGGAAAAVSLRRRRTR